MRELARLLEATSNVLQVPEKTVRSRVMLLRKHSLWTSIGKGISADPAPSDASNLLLSFLGGGLVTETADTVRLLRNCHYIAPYKNAALPPISLFAEFRHKHTLGDMLDALFTHWSERGPPVSLKSNLPFTDASFLIERYSRGWDAELRLLRHTQPTKWSNEEDYRIEYELIPEFLIASGQKQLVRAAQRMAERRGDLVTSARISERTFTTLADCLTRAKHRTTRQPG